MDRSYLSTPTKQELVFMWNEDAKGSTVGKTCRFLGFTGSLLDYPGSFPLIDLDDRDSRLYPISQSLGGFSSDNMDMLVAGSFYQVLGLI